MPWSACCGQSLRWRRHRRRLKVIRVIMLARQLSCAGSKHITGRMWPCGRRDGGRHSTATPHRGHRRSGGTARGRKADDRAPPRHSRSYIIVAAGEQQEAWSKTTNIVSGGVRVGRPPAGCAQQRYNGTRYIIMSRRRHSRRQQIIMSQSGGRSGSAA